MKEIIKKYTNMSLPKYDSFDQLVFEHHYSCIKCGEVFQEKPSECICGSKKFTRLRKHRERYFEISV